MIGTAWEVWHPRRLGPHRLTPLLLWKQRPPSLELSCLLLNQCVPTPVRFSWASIGSVGHDPSWDTSSWSFLICWGSKPESEGPPVASLPKTGSSCLLFGNTVKGWGFPHWLTTCEFGYFPFCLGMSAVDWSYGCLLSYFLSLLAALLPSVLPSFSAPHLLPIPLIWGWLDWASHWASALSSPWDFRISGVPWDGATWAVFLGEQGVVEVPRDREKPL